MKGRVCYAWRTVKIEVLSYVCTQMRWPRVRKKLELEEKSEFVGEK